VWDLFQPKRIITAEDAGGGYSEEHHLAEMISTMGMPPLDFLKRSEKAGKLFSAHGNMIGCWRSGNMTLTSCK